MCARTWSCVSRRSCPWFHTTHHANDHSIDFPIHIPVVDYSSMPSSSTQLEQLVGVSSSVTSTSTPTISASTSLEDRLQGVEDALHVIMIDNM